MFANIQQLIFQMHFHEKRIETLLNDNQPFYPNFTIAGGAIRDLFLGREIKDIDVCIEKPTGSDKLKFIEADNERYDMGLVKFLGHVPQSIHEDAPKNPIEFIVRDVGIDPDTLVLYHCCGLSNAFWVHGKLILDETFLEDVADKVIRYSRKAIPGVSGSNKAINAYLTRIHQKYPDFRLELLPEDKDV